MKVLHINTSSTKGGAAIAAYRLHLEMRKRGIDSTFFSFEELRTSNYISVSLLSRYLIFPVIKIKNILFRKKFLDSKKKGLFSNLNYGLHLNLKKVISDYDVIYIHWINGGFLSLHSLESILASGKKIFWFMHDMFPITGGCHHSFECTGYQKLCGNCSYLKKQSKYDFSYRQINRKLKLLNKFNNVSFIAPSKWLYNVTSLSTIAKTHKVLCIPNVLDENIFKKLDKNSCRLLFNIPQDYKIILFGADSALTNPYKGFSYFIDALKNLSNACNEKIMVVIFGAEKVISIEKDIPYETLFLGSLRDNYTLAALYNSADVFCIPSLAENYANTILEALHCETPVVGFNIGGIPDLVSNKTGYLAEYKNSQDFSYGIKKVLQGDISYDYSLIPKVYDIIDSHKFNCLL